MNCDAQKLYVIYGDNPDEMINKLFSKVKIEERIDKNARIGIKPNLVVAKPADLGATTSEKLCEAVIAYLKAQGFTDIVILEGSWIGESTARAFSVCGYTQLSEKYGVPLIDLQRDAYSSVTVDGIEIAVCDAVRGVDYLINMPVLKGHCQTKITCALKNLKGCIPNSEKRRFHRLGLHKPIAVLNKAIKTDLIIVDGLVGDLNFEEGGNPVQMDRIIVGFDPVLVDSYAAELLGYSPEEIEYITMAEELGVGKCLENKEQVVELNPQKHSKKIPHSREVAQLARYLDDWDACSACYGSAIHALARLDEQGLLDRINTKLVIGQGYQGMTGDSAVGIGSCTSGFTRHIKGCPPTAKTIIDKLMEQFVLK